MAKKPQRKFETYSRAVHEAGFDITKQYSAPELVPASRFADHLSVPWRAQKLLPGMDYERAVRLIRTGVKATMEKLRISDTHPFSRDVYYAIARRRVH